MRQPVIALCTVSPLHIGGAETNMLQIAGHLKDKFQIIIIGPMSPGFQKKIIALGIRNIQIPMVSKFSVITVIRLANIFNREKVQIVHTHDTRGGLLGRIAARIAGAKVVHTVHMLAVFQTTHPLKQRFYGLVETILNHKFTDRIIFVSNSVKGLCLSRGLAPEAKCIHVPNGVNLNHFEKIRKESLINRDIWRKKLGISENEIIVSWVGRISHQKGLDSLVKAATMLKNNSVKFLIIGDGQKRKQIELLCKKFELEDQFIFTGFRQKDEVYQFLGASDLFVLPSRYECLPYVILETMAAGLPCIVTDVGGNRELVKDGYNGIIVPSQKYVELANAIKILLNDPKLRQKMGRKSLKLIQKYDEQSMVKKIEKIYNSLLL